MSRLQAKDFKKFPDVISAVDDAEKKLKDRGRILVRPSGTEPKVRVMVEAENDDLAKKCAESVADAIRKNMGQEAS